MKAFHILNPSRLRLDAVRAVVDARHLSSPWAWVAREHPDHTETLVQWALDEGVQRLVVWGGDGTLHRVVAALWRARALHSVEIGLVPAGTCNDLARRMGLRFEEWPSWQADKPEGRRAAMSLGLLKAGPAVTPFVNNAGIGRSGAAARKKTPAWKTLFSFSPLPLSVRWGGGELRGVYYLGLFCLGPYFSGGLHFEPEPSPERGEVRTYLVPARSRLRLAARLIRGRLGAPLADAKVTAFSARGLWVRSEAPLWPQADGEPAALEPVKELTVSTAPETWSLWVPS